MTRNEVREATGEAVLAAEYLAAHLARLHGRLAPNFPLSATELIGWNDEQRERLHALLRMFEQLYDLGGRKLIRGFLLLSGENAAALSASNAARRVEALGALPSADQWLQLGAVRNALIHDYPINPERQSDLANTAWEEVGGLLAATRLLIQRLREECLP